MASRVDISMDLSAYLDGELGPEAAGRVDRAATASSEVARRLHDLRRLRAILRAFEPVRPGSDFVARVIAEARRRGLMRRVVRQRRIAGAMRLASAAAAAMLVATIAGVAYQSWTHRADTGGAGASAPPPALAVVPERDRLDQAGRASSSAGTDDKRGLSWSGDMPHGKGGAAPVSRASSLRRLELAVTDVGAGAKEVTAALTDAGLAKTDINNSRILTALASAVSESAEAPRAGKARAARAPRLEVGGGVSPAMKAKAGKGGSPEEALGLAKPDPAPGEPVGFARIPAGEGEVRFAVVAPPDRIEALFGRLGHLRGRQAEGPSACDVCLAGTTTHGPRLPESSAPAAPASPNEIAANAAKAATTAPVRPTGPEWGVARLRRIGDGQNGTAVQAQGEIDEIRRELGATSAPAAQASQASQAAAPARRSELLIITVRRRPPDNPPDPGRNTFGP